jgi:acyl carrier protein
VSRSEQEIQDWIVARVGGLTGMAPGEINVNEPLLRFGLDSVAVVALVAELEQWLGYRFRENPLDEYPTVAALSRFLAGQVAEGSSRGEA